LYRRLKRTWRGRLATSREESDVSPTGNDGKCDRVVAGDQNGKVAPAVSARFFAAGDPTS